jgi:hypothetical protein
MIKTGLLIFSLPGWMIFMNACVSKKQGKPVERHAAEINNKGIGMIYADKIPCNAVMQETRDTGSHTVFHCYRIGFIDSLFVAKATGKKDLDAGKYYQYGMEKDWVALVNGDSLTPVFFQPKERFEEQRHEAVIVFETPGDKEPDTLIYKDSYGAWSTQQLILNSNKK